jgi:hypothetical protein
MARNSPLLNPVQGTLLLSCCCSVLLLPQLVEIQTHPGQWYGEQGIYQNNGIKQPAQLSL